MRACRRGEFRRLDRGRRAHLPVTVTAHGKRVQALGGAKNHLVVMPDADLDQASSTPWSAPHTARPANAAWRSRSRVAVGGDRRMQLVDRLGPPDPQAQGRDRAPIRTSDMGPLVTAAHHLDRVDRLHRHGGVDGRRASRGRRPRPQACKATRIGLLHRGHSLFDHVTPDMRIYTRRDLWPGALGLSVRLDGLDERRSPW